MVCMCVCVCVCLCLSLSVYVYLSRKVAVHRKTMAMSIALNGAYVKYSHIFRLIVQTPR